jgi:cobalt/nickel transport protein
MPDRLLSYPATLAALLLGVSTALAAPMGVLIPSASILAGETKTVALQGGMLDPLSPWPAEGGKPPRFGVQHLGEQSDLLATLKLATTQGAIASRSFPAWQLEFAAKHPGDYTFYLESAPVWEAGEELFLVLLTKLCVNAGGLEEGWDEPVGLELEIVPLSRPYGLWTGNLFSGQVLLKGEPAPYVEVAISRFTDPAAPTPPAGLPPAYVVQKIRADSNGVFHYAMPRSGWWGFTALSEAEWSLPKAGVDKPVLLGAGYWVQARDLP